MLESEDETTASGSQKTECSESDYVYENIDYIMVSVSQKTDPSLSDNEHETIAASTCPETESSESDSDSIEVDPFLFRIHEKLAFTGLKYAYDVPQLFFEYLVIYLKDILRGMSAYKVHYQITCPMLTEGNIIDPNAVIESRRVYYGRGRFSVQDFKEFLNENEDHGYLFPNRRVYLRLKDKTASFLPENVVKK